MTRRHIAIYLLIFLAGCVAIGAVVGVIVGSCLKDALRGVEGRVKSLEEWRWSPRTFTNDRGG